MASYKWVIAIISGLLCYGLSLQCLSSLNMDVKRIGYTQKTIGGAVFSYLFSNHPGIIFRLWLYILFLGGEFLPMSNKNHRICSQEIVMFNWTPKQLPKPQGDFEQKMMDTNHQTFRSVPSKWRNPHRHIKLYGYGLWIREFTHSPKIAGYKVFRTSILGTWNSWWKKSPPEPAGIGSRTWICIPATRSLICCVLVQFYRALKFNSEKAAKIHPPTSPRDHITFCHGNPRFPSFLGVITML